MKNIIKISRIEILQNELRQIENEKKHYAKTGNQEMFFPAMQESIRIEKSIKELSK